MKPIFFAIVAIITLVPVACLAHTQLVRSSPADNASLEKSPSVATLVFAEPVTLTAVRIESRGGVTTAIKSLPAKPTAKASVALPTLGPGFYKMSWRAIGDDGHIMSGEIHFSVGEKPAH